MIEQSVHDPPLQAAASRTGGSKALWAAVTVGIVACLLAASYVVRTPLVSGAPIARRLEALARRHRVDLRVGSFRPHGLYGLRFEQVQLLARHGAYLVEADLDAVDVTPSLDALVQDGQIRPASVEVHGGRIHVVRRPAPAPAPSATQAKPAASAKADRPVKSAAPAEPAAPPSIHAVLHDVSFSAQPDPLPGTTHPLVLHRAEVSLTPSASGAASAVDFRHGYGQFPDGTPFAVRQTSAEGGPETYVVEPEAPTRLDRWIDMPVPLQVSVGAMRVCPECQPANLRLDRVHVAGPRALSADSPRLALSAGASEVRLDLGEVTFAQKRTRLPYRLRNFEVLYDTQTRTAIVQGDVADDRAGKASFASNWSGQWGVLETNIQLRQFHTDRLWAPLGLDAHVHGGVHTGEVETSFEPSLDLVEISMDLVSQELTVALPVVTDDPLDFERLGLKLEASLQPKARTLNVSRGQARLGAAGPIEFGGYATDADKGVVFDTYAHAEKLHPQRLRDGLPPTLAKLARGTQFDGEFGFDIRSAGHTAFPESISLSVDFSGRVEVRGDSGYADVLALASDGPPSIDLPGTLAQNVATDAWVAYDSLPAYVPQVLTAAEDAKFFKHDGFDWGGLRRALVYNVEQGGIERGGSTLSQQLSKNLFLDHERTLARKLQEAYVTWRLESELSKERILELYMNMVEWGPNIQGLKQASRRYFDTSPAALSIAQTALLAAVLPGPSLYGQQVLAGYLPSSRVEKIEHILSNLRFLGVITGRQYRAIYAAAKQGQIGSLELAVCDDDGKAPEGAPRCP